MLFAYFPFLFLYQEEENANAPTTIRLIEASLQREDVADRKNFRLLLHVLLQEGQFRVLSSPKT